MYRIVKTLRWLGSCFIFSERCRICRQLFPPPGWQELKVLTICPACWQQLECPPSISWHALPEGNSLLVASASCYKGAMKKLIYKLKYDGDRLLAGDLGLLLIRAWEALDFKTHLTPLLVPVPLHQERLAARGFNQAELLAKELAVFQNLTVEVRALARIKSTVFQHGLSKVERHSNLSGAFLANASRIEDRTLVLIDDVLTSGATLSEAARVLTHAGARNVYAITLARALLS